MTSLKSRVLGGLYGLLIGDALGVPFEFHSPADIPAAEDISFDLPAGFRRAHPSAPKNAWSDDGAQALCLLSSLLTNGRLNMADFAMCLRKWDANGFLAVDNEVFDIGNQTRIALDRLEQGVPVDKAAPSDVSANGNGSLMRVLPLVLWHQGTEAELVELAHQQSHVTHAHAKAKVCCALYCLIARALIRSATVEDARSKAFWFLQQHYTDEVFKTELALVLHEMATVPPRGSGYVVDTLAGALQCLSELDYASVVRAAIRLGNDTDTTAAVAGGLAGIMYGLEGIPLEWREALAGMDIATPIANRLLKEVLA